jgi:tripartite ATP-independent transporter DctM subunit
VNQAFAKFIQGWNMEKLDENRNTESSVGWPILGFVRIITGIGAVTLTGLVFFTFVDVVLRYIFNRPTVGGFELSEYATAIIVATSISYTTFKKGHIGVNLVIQKLSQKRREIINTVTWFLSLMIFVLITWQTILYAKELSKTFQASASLHIPTPPFVLMVAVASAAASLLVGVDIFHRVSCIIKNSSLSVKFSLAIYGILAIALITLSLWSPWKFSPPIVGYIGVAVLFILLFSGMSIGLVMILIGFLGMAYLVSMPSGLSFLGTVPYVTIANYSLAVLPLFILMGELAFASGLSDELYLMFHKWIGHWPGGLAMATVGGCALFGAVCGSSTATAATLATVALPEMRKYNYNSALATGALASAGTLGILIPPSNGFIIYSLTTNLSIGKLFIAGIVPGIILSILFMATIYIWVKSDKKLAPLAPSSTWKDRFLSLKGAWGVIILFGVVMGGLYLGVFSPTEAAGIGAFGGFAFALLRRRLTFRRFTKSLLATMEITGMIFLIIIGTMMFGYFLALTNVPANISLFVGNLQVSRIYILLGVLVLYVILGCLMDVVAMVLLTMPFVFPIIDALGYDPIWFGVIMVVVMEMGLVTPPVGLNVYVISGMVKDVSMYTIFRGVTPFLLAIIVMIAILIFFPGIALVLL